LALAGAAGAAVAIFHASVWPQCLSRFDAVSPEAQSLWLRYVQEAWPFYQQSWRAALLIIALPIAGLVGWGMLGSIRRNDGEQLRRVLGVAAPALAATLLLFWESRTAPAAQVMSVVGGVALIWFLVPVAWRSKSDVLGVAGALLVAVIGVGAIVPLLLSFVPLDTPSERDAAIYYANFACKSVWGMREVGLQPRGVVFTFVDLGPRLITLTDHDAVAGPYHRNSQQIVDTTNAFLGSAGEAHRIIAKYHSSYVLTCPGSWLAYHFIDESPGGFYAQLEQGDAPGWLAPVDLGGGSPFKMWRVVG
jgi:hypothetical protein